MRDLRIILLLITASLLMLVVIGYVNAASDYITEPTPVPVFIPSTASTNDQYQNRTYPIHRISQGDTVYMGDHIDISGVVAGNKALVWFRAGDPDPSEIPYVMPLPTTKAGYYDFYINPDTFMQMTGNWFKWNGYYESNGNTHAFYVVSRARNTTLTYPNGTMIETTEYLSGNYTEAKLPVEYPLPVKHVADYLIARGDRFNITVENETRIWLFGRVDQLAGYRSVGGSVDLGADLLSGFEPGSYKMLMQTIGNRSNDFTVKYDAEDETIKWFDPSQFKVHSEFIGGYSPQVLYEKFVGLLPEFQDTFREYKVEIQEPGITLQSMDFVSVNSAQTYYYDSNYKGDLSLYDIRGYTNALPGTTIRVALDESQQVKVHWINTTVQGEFLGDMRYYQAYIPIYWDDMKEGMHRISAYTESGASVFRDFPVSISPDHSYIPNKSVKWVEDSNPWKPNLTIPEPIIVTRTVEVVKEVEVPPSAEMVYAQQLEAARIINEKNKSDAFMIGFYIIIIALALLGIGYLIGVYRRAKL
jgi:hypothetical protein